MLGVNNIIKRQEGRKALEAVQNRYNQLKHRKRSAELEKSNKEALGPLPKVIDRGWPKGAKRSFYDDKSYDNDDDYRSGGASRKRRSKKRRSSKTKRLRKTRRSSKIRRKTRKNRKSRK